MIVILHDDIIKYIDIYVYLLRVRSSKSGIHYA